MGFTLKGPTDPARRSHSSSGLDYYRIKADFSGFIAGQPVIYVDTGPPSSTRSTGSGDLGLHAGARYDYDSSFGN